MTAASLTFSIASVLCFVYLGLAFAVIPNLKPEKRKEQREWLLALTLWWPFYGDLYDGSKRERSLRLCGKLLLLAIVAMYVAYFTWLRHGA